MFKKRDQDYLAEAYTRINESHCNACSSNIGGAQSMPKPVIVTMDMPGATTSMGTDDMDSGHEHDPSEIEMAAADLYKLSEYASKLKEMVQDMPSLEGWVASKITKASDYISSVYHYLEFNQHETGCDGNMFTSTGAEDHCKYAAEGCTCGGCNECH